MTEETHTRIELYAFEYFDEPRQKWMRARYRCQLAEIRERYKLFRTVGGPEVRDVPDDLGKRMPYGPSMAELAADAVRAHQLVHDHAGAGPTN